MDASVLQRPVKPKKEKQLTFGGLNFQALNWKDYWWGMPSFEMKDATPSHRVTVNFLTMEDYADFQARLGVKLSAKSDSMWFPPQERTNGQFSWEGEQVKPRYPIYIPSKGRWENQTTGRLLESVGITDYRFCVEETEAEQYVNAVGENHVLVMQRVRYETGSARGSGPGERQRSGCRGRGMNRIPWGATIRRGGHRRRSAQ